MATLPPLAERHFGLDLDNTIILYSEVFRTAALALGLIPSDFAASKAMIRTHVRALPDGEREWQRLQSWVYGPGVAGATIAPGAPEFIARCRASGATVSIVSHKTRHGAIRHDGPDFHQAARAWLTAHGLVGGGTALVSADAVFFEATRAGKVARLRALGCTDIVDDLEEVFLEQSFPRDVASYLLALDRDDSPEGPWTLCRNWRQIEDHVYR